jgi:hypothetical protein
MRNAKLAKAAVKRPSRCSRRQHFTHLESPTNSPVALVSTSGYGAATGDIVAPADGLTKAKSSRGTMRNDEVRLNEASSYLRLSKGESAWTPGVVCGGRA